MERFWTVCSDALERYGVRLGFGFGFGVTSIIGLMTRVRPALHRLPCIKTRVAASALSYLMDWDGCQRGSGWGNLLSESASP